MQRTSSSSDPRLLAAASAAALMALAPGAASAQLCAAPTPIACGEVVDATTSGASLIDAYGCLAWPLAGPEAVYAFTATAGQTVTLTASAVTPWDVAVTVLPASAGDCAPLECTAAADDGESNPETLTVVFPAAGLYYLLIDGYAGGAQSADGPFSLAVDCSCADHDGDGESAVDPSQCVAGTDCCDTGDEPGVLGCSAATAASIAAGAYDLCGDGIDQDCDGVDAPCEQACVDAHPVACSASVSGTTPAEPSRIDAYACLPRMQTGGEVTYRLELSERRRVVATVTGAHDASVAILPERLGVCDTSSCLAGADAGTTGAEQSQAFLDPGVYYVVVDGFNYSGGAFGLEVACDVCDDVDGDAAIGLSASCGAGLDCCDRGDEASPGCTEARAHAIHRGAVDFCGDNIDHDCDGRDCLDDLDHDGAHAASQGGLDCCDRGDETAHGCTAASAATMHPGAREVCGNGIDEDCDGVDPACPTCGADALLACGDRGAGDTTGASALVGDYCGAGAGYWTGGERVYALTAASDVTVRLTVAYDPQSASLDVVALDDAGVSGICDPASCLAGSFSGSGVELVTFYAAAGHTYYLAVDDRMGGGAPFTYEVDCAVESLPPATPVACDEAVPGSTAAGQGQVDAYAGIGYPLRARERVFTFAPGLDARVDVELAFDGGASRDLGVLVLGDDCGGANPAGHVVAFSDAHQADGAPSGEAVSFDAHACATYSIVVDGYRPTDAGAFTLGVSCPVRCNQGETLCGGRDCVDLSTSPVHCGACAAPCAAGAVCIAAACCPDEDHDGHPAATCGGDDCDDGDAAAHPGATDACGDGVDQDCSGGDPSCPRESVRRATGCAGVEPGPGLALLTLLWEWCRRRRRRRETR